VIACNKLVVVAISEKFILVQLLKKIIKKGLEAIRLGLNIGQKLD
jgi:hypothetical protein